MKYYLLKYLAIFKFGMSFNCICANITTIIIYEFSSNELFLYFKNNSYTVFSI